MDNLYEFINDYKKAVNNYLNEEEEHGGYDESKSIPYTTQDEIFGETIDSARELFGANFSGVKDPMRYYPEADGMPENVSLSGKISQLNDAAFQFWLKEKNNAGCVIRCDLLTLNEDNVRLLGIIYGAYDTWKRNLSSMGDIAPMTFHANDDGNMVPGDDFGSNK